MLGPRIFPPPTVLEEIFLRKLGESKPRGSNNLANSDRMILLVGVVLVLGNVMRYWKQSLLEFQSSSKCFDGFTVCIFSGQFTSRDFLGIVTSRHKVVNVEVESC